MGVRVYATIMIAALAVAACAMPIADEMKKDACNGDDYGTAGQFDFYVFQQEWPAQFCSGQSYPLCQQPTPFMKTNLAIHGLWPNYDAEQNGHDWPQCCQSPYGPDLNQTALNLLAADMHYYWPDEQAQPGYNTSSFWAHEWGKHGTCSGLDQYTYFSSAISVEQSQGTPAVLTSNAGGSVALSDLYSAYGQPVCDQSGSCMVSVDCSNGAINTVTTCWDKGTLQQIECPNAVISSDNCPDPIQVASF